MKANVLSLDIKSGGGKPVLGVLAPCDTPMDKVCGKRQKILEIYKINLK